MQNFPHAFQEIFRDSFFFLVAVAILQQFKTVDIQTPKVLYRRLNYIRLHKTSPMQKW